jgi:hypothetical protein
MDKLVLSIAIFLFGLLAGCVMTHDDFVERLIDAGLAEFQVDSTTGETTFIIHAEHNTNNK